MKNKKLILWDLDGTLMTCGAAGTRALNETFRRLYGIEDAFSKGGRRACDGLGDSGSDHGGQQAGPRRT
jgi:phosphoglycolate phosphatase-like HAD superfamily hydrolase